MPKENKIRILYVQPGKYPEERIIDNTLKAYQSLVYGDIESVAPWRTNVRVVCNQEGKLNGMPPNRLLGDYDILMGSFFICGLRNVDCAEFYCAAGLHLTGKATGTVQRTD